MTTKEPNAELSWIAADDTFAEYVGRDSGKNILDQHSLDSKLRTPDHRLRPGLWIEPLAVAVAIESQQAKLSILTMSRVFRPNRMS